ncbi:hypothetical protein OU415_07245 [Saccharopolyspora sp. WRP15-2]|uniref:Ketohydroxyglutarate aldolase n=1 Tax=Saccharopolyspora oryzae TaxID=2997343 RepID=A0ABT4UVT6_9PSEU|nr:hypothetical protein [Saccharopolyspora oryzae]MDA3625224.1 hypothetical protein [Saccharopolyspora oryzae]
MTRRGWVITASIDRDLAEIAAALAALGFTDIQVHDRIGVLVGTAPENVVDDVREMDGVVDVSPEGQVDAGPFDAPTSW